MSEGAGIQIMGSKKPPLPDGWRWVRLEDHVTKVGSGITPLGGEAVYVQSGIPLIRSQNVHPNRFVLGGLAFITAAQDAEMEGSRVCPGDVLLNITGASIGRVCVVPSKMCPANVNQHVSIIRCTPDLYPPFLSYYISTPDFQKFIMDTQAGATRQALTKTLIEDFQIPLPPLPEQQRIAAILNEQMAAVERTRAAAEERVEAAEALPSAFLRAVFSSPEARAWLRKRLGDFVLSYRNGFGRRPSGVEEGPIVLRLADVSAGVVDLTHPRCVTMSKDEIEMYRLVKGDLIFIRVNGSRDLIGRCILINESYENLVYNDHLIRVQLNSQLAPEYLQVVSESPEVRDAILSGATTTAGQLTINQDLLASLQVPTPAYAEQQLIVGAINERTVEIARARKALEEELATINALPAAFLRRAFSGEI